MLIVAAQMHPVARSADTTLNRWEDRSKLRAQAVLEHEFRHPRTSQSHHRLDGVDPLEQVPTAVLDQRWQVDKPVEPCGVQGAISIDDCCICLPGRRREATVAPLTKRHVGVVDAFAVAPLAQPCVLVLQSLRPPRVRSALDRALTIDGA